MTNSTYDLIVVGGGLAGSALSKAMAERGARVLVLERETVFRDRVRGELMHPWGVTEARALGIYDLLLDACGHHVRWWNTYFDAVPVARRDLVETTSHRSGCLDFYHPEMQEVLLRAAGRAGAEVRRGVSVVDIVPGQSPSVTTRTPERVETFRARLVVGADGRSSKVRRQAGFRVHHDPDGLMMAGVLLTGMAVSEEEIHVFFQPTRGHGALVVPVGKQRFRMYYIFRKGSVRQPLSGREFVPELLAASGEAGVPSDWYANARVTGPLATFDGADVWVEHPFRDGAVLVGDAAAASDLAWGCGLSLTLRDVRVLRDRLSESDDLPAAADAYAREHDQYYGALHRVEAWLAAMMFDTGPDGDQRRARALLLLAREPDRVLDIVALGPETPSDETARRRFFAEDLSFVTKVILRFTGRSILRLYKLAHSLGVIKK